MSVKISDICTVPSIAKAAPGAGAIEVPAVVVFQLCVTVVSSPQIFD
ncbi:hypothetical protein ACFVXW_16020 [Streptomyces sp. NPDC058251]